MKVERSSIEDVRAKLAKLKKKKEEPEKELSKILIYIIKNIILYKIF